MYFTIGWACQVHTWRVEHLSTWPFEIFVFDQNGVQFFCISSNTKVEKKTVLSLYVGLHLTRPSFGPVCQRAYM